MMSRLAKMSFTIVAVLILAACGRSGAGTENADASQNGAQASNREVINENSAEIRRIIDNLLLTSFGDDALDVRIRENGDLMLVPNNWRMKEAIEQALTDPEMGDVLALSIVRLSEIIQDTYGLSGVRISLMDHDNDEVALVVAMNGHLVSTSRLQMSELE